MDKYNDTEHSITGFAPKYLLDGTDVNILPKELKAEKTEDKWTEDKKIHTHTHAHISHFTFTNRKNDKHSSIQNKCHF